MNNISWRCLEFEREWHENNLGRVWRHTNEEALKFEFKYSNNQVEYEDLIAGMVVTLEMRTFQLKAKSDSQLVANKVYKNYHTKEP